MRVGVFGDVHGNLPALEVLIKDLRQVSPDLIVCLGDLVDGFGHPHECVEIVRELAPHVCVLGNAEWRVREWPASKATLRDGAEPLFAWVMEQLSDEDRALLSAMPLTAEVEGLLVFHGQPDDPFAGIRPPPQEWPVIWHAPHLGFIRRDEARVPQALEGIPSGWLVCAHTHHRMVRRWRELTIVNPGPLCFGDYLAGGRMDAQYALLDRAGDGWEITWRDLEYDKRAAADSIERQPVVTPFMARVAARLRSEA